jgi:anti-sigma regulatory factor (Ser/Thr protein kinase)/serine/threonine protein phosphatase PrpC
MAEELTSQAVLPAVLLVETARDVERGSDLIKSFADSLGFSAEHREELALVAKELGTNLLRHAGHGKLIFTAIQTGGRKGIQVESDDSGPGIADIEQALADGYSTAGGLGLGLGTVNRLMDELDIHSAARAGVHVLCRRWLRPQSRGLYPHAIAFGAATRSRRSFEENGDSFLIKQWDGHALVGVIDGLGHGPLAHRASQTARQYIEQHYDQPLDRLFQGVGRACRATRGVVMALAAFDGSQRRFRVASIGNIEMRLIGSSEAFRPVVRRGIVGFNAPDPVCTEHAWDAKGLLILHSDGVAAHWDWNDFKDLAAEAPGAIAQKLLRDLAKPDDDATVIVARSAAP